MKAVDPQGDPPMSKGCGIRLRDPSFLHIAFAPRGNVCVIMRALPAKIAERQTVREDLRGRADPQSCPSIFKRVSALVEENWEDIRSALETDDLRQMEKGRTYRLFDRKLFMMIDRRQGERPD